MLIQQDFNFARAGIINPSAVFFSDRDLYYNMLSQGDTGTDEGLLEWCRYVIRGIASEMEKVERLLDYGYLKESVLIPAIKTCTSRGELSKDEERILLLAAEDQVIMAADVKKAMAGLQYQTVLRRMKKLRDRGLLENSQHVARAYRLQFADNALMRSIVSMLRQEGFFSGLEDAG